jgi:hypothetical protein
VWVRTRLFQYTLFRKSFPAPWMATIHETRRVTLDHFGKNYPVPLCPSHEIRRESVSDRVSGHLDRAIFGVAPCALAGEPLL